MGMNSNRPENRSERLSRYTKEISTHEDNQSFDFELSVGSQIRGDLGIEKGNEFINAIRQASKK